MGDLLPPSGLLRRCRAFACQPRALVLAAVAAVAPTARAAPTNLAAQEPGPGADAWQAARANAARSRQAVSFCLRYAHGWLGHADPRSGLLPRTLTGDAFWNAKDCAADNFPFLAMTAHLTGQPHLLAAAAHVFAQERRLTATPLGLPDDFDFGTQAQPARAPRLDQSIFGAAEYCKDGLLPLLEWTGDPDYEARLIELLRAILAQAAVPSPAGAIPSRELEVNGDLLQALSRAAWLTGDAAFAAMAFRLGDHYLLHEPLLSAGVLPLRDHGCEVIGGLAEAYVLAAHRDPPRRERWRPPLRALLACVAEHGVRDDGLLYDAIDPRDGRAVRPSASDGWGYVLDAFVAVAAADGDEALAAVARRCLARVASVRIEATAGLGGADGCADTLEGAINLLARFPEPATRTWIDREMQRLVGLQRADGVIEGWYGDGNSARTAWMWALMQTCGVRAQPWRADLELGAEATPDGGIRLLLRAEFAWHGELCFDRPRHRELMHMPFDVARINQWPEWFTVVGDRSYELQLEDGEAAQVTGEALRRWPARLRGKDELRLVVVPRAK